jgi:hypothetical protein
MYTAAIAATSSLQLQVSNWRAARDVNCWLEKHGSKALQQLSLCADETVGTTCDDTDVAVSLPWESISQLQSLSFSGNMLVMPHPPRESSVCGGRSYSASSSDNSRAESDSNDSSSSSSNPLALLTALTHLQLHGCHAGFGFGLQQITALSALQRLELEALPKPYALAINEYAIGWGTAYSVHYGETLGQLSQLTALTLSSCDGWLDSAALTAASNLTNLQELTLGAMGSEQQPVKLLDLPTSLVTANLVCCISTAMPDASSSSNSSWELPLLRSLQLQFAVFQPAALLRMAQLQKLECSFVCTSQGKGMAMGDILPVLPSLQQLQHLSITGCQGSEEETEAAEYAALTSSSHLTALELHGCAIPAAAAQHLLAAGKQLPQLQCITIEEFGDVSSSGEIGDDDDDEFASSSEEIGDDDDDELVSISAEMDDDDFDGML